MKSIAAFIFLIALTNTAFSAPKNIHLNVGISNFNSASYTKKLPVSKNTMECNSDDAKQFVASIFEREGNTPSFIGGYKILKKSENVSYCSVSYKNAGDISKQTFWIIKEEDKIYFYDYESMPVACDCEEVHEYIKEIAARRKITIDELGGLEESETFNDTTLCTLAYKASDMNDLAKLNYSLSRDEDFNVVMTTEDNEFEN
ncbi:MAG: hypothetical protein V2A75_02020 [Pseudomonadota bacterium]